MMFDLPDAPAWFRDALCRGVGNSLFFADSKGDGTGICRRAKAICAGCPVRQTCLEYGLDERDGIWGGLSYRDRRKYKAENGMVVVP